MKSRPQIIGDLFVENIRYVIPIFQRHYVWEEKKQWIPLWDDIRGKTLDRINKRKPHPHFFGSLVLAHKRLSTTQAINTFIVIDGQQRLTTLQLLLAALKEICRQHHRDDLLKEIENLLLNQHHSIKEAADRYKLWPTQFDQKTYHDILSLSLAEFEKKHNAYNIDGFKRFRKDKMQQDHILGAYLFFANAISTFIREDAAAVREHPIDAGNILNFIFLALKNDFQIVEILLDQDDPQMIFETLNARGTPLSAADLIRNYIFMRAERNGEEMDKLYVQHWSALETQFWSDKISQGKHSEERLVFFFFNYLSYQTGNEIRLDKVFPDYKSWIINHIPFTSVTEELDDIQQAAKIYEVLAGKVQEKSVLSAFAKRLQSWKITAIYPLIMLIELEGQLDESERAGMYTDLDSYLVRRMVCGKTPKNYNNVFLTLMKKLRKTGINRKNMQIQLLFYKENSNIWPSDAEFEKAWLENPVYPASSYTAERLSPSLIRNILHILEKQGSNRFSEDITINSELTVEHIMPDKWFEHWPLDGQKISKEESDKALLSSLFEQDENGVNGRIHRRNTLLHSFGNLTLLTQSLNSSVSCGSFDRKREAISKQSALGLNRYFLNVDTWDEEAIQKRGRHLFQLALTAWPKAEKQPDTLQEAS